MKITVLAGGLSPERDVSLVSGALIANALRRKGHLVALADLYLGGNAGFTTAMSPIPKVGHSHPDLAALIAQNNNRTSPIADGIIGLCRSSDVTFLALHGASGEDGTIQALLDCEGIRYTGSGHAACAVAMDKDLTKRLIRFDGIPTADWLKFTLGDTAETADAIESKVGCPCVIKPLDGGSSVGVEFAYDRVSLESALDKAKADGHSKHFIAEKLIRGREFSVGVLMGKALPVIEIIPKAGFYDYKNKYTAGMTEEIVPAHLTDEQTARLQALALAAHNALGMGSYSRSDFMLDEATGEFMCLEVNTLPGMTPTSLLPQEAAAVGIGYDELCEMIAMDAVNDK